MRLRTTAMVIIGLIVYIVLSSSADAGGGVGAASSPGGFALSGKILQLKLEAAKSESEAIDAEIAIYRQAIIEIRIFKLVLDIIALPAKFLTGTLFIDGFVPQFYNIAELATEFE